MRSLTKLAIASVVVAAVCGVFHPFCGDQRKFAIRTNDRTERQLIRQGAGQNDQNLKLLLAAKIFAGVGIVADRKDHGDPDGRSSSADSRGKPSS
jgi:hypothetical protein